MPQEYRQILKYADEPGYTPDMECYLRHGGYEALKKAFSIQPRTLPDGKATSAQELLRQEVKASGLRGRGGAGFSCRQARLPAHQSSILSGCARLIHVSNNR